jgi:hypothetical protein
VEVTGGDFEAFLEATVIIVALYEQDPSILDYTGGGEFAPPPQERRVKGLLNLSKLGETHSCFNHRLYRKEAFQRLMGER